LDKLKENTVEFLWMYNNWVEDIMEKHDFAKQYSHFIGAFSNPEMARQIAHKEKSTVAVSEEQLEQTMAAIDAGYFNKPQHRRRRRK
jgi:hypothetical protein